jgi:uncharacterized protein YdgA (DUF945 family)
MTQETLKLALEALELSAVTVDSFGVQKKTNEAITAIKEALAQEQEPVATLAVRWHNPVGKVAYVLEVDLPTGIHKLYTHPPQRTWMGLTDEEYFGLQMKIKTPMISVQDYIDAMRMVEAKLKQKNGYAEEKNT